jgi:hypothetical protein
MEILKAISIAGIIVSLAGLSLVAVTNITRPSQINGHGACAHVVSNSSGWRCVQP